MPHAQVAQYYQLIDVLVYPRLPMRLTELVTPLKPLEAMAQGRLVAASDVGGHRELIKDGQTGVLFRANDADALAQSVLALLDQPDQLAAAAPPRARLCGTRTQLGRQRGALRRALPALDGATHG